MSLKPARWLSAFAALALAASTARAAPLDGELRGAETPALVDEAPSPADSPALSNAEQAPPDEEPSDAPPRKPKPNPGALPELKPYPTADRFGRKGGPTPLPGVPGPTVAAEPVAPLHKIRREDKPFDPVGLYVGNLRLTPYFEQDIGYATNPYGAPGNGRGSALSTTEAGVGLESNWSRNSLTGFARLGYNEYFQTPGASAPFGAGLVDYRHDYSRDLTFDTEGRFSITNETNAQLGLGGVTNQNLVLVSTYGATVGGANKFGDLTVGLHGTIDRVNYNGGGLQGDNYNDYGLKLRAAYRWTEAFQPFAEIDGDVRAYDSLRDEFGYERSNDGVAGKAGATMVFSELLKGEASLGLGGRDYQDPRLRNVLTPLIDASLTWAPTALTTVTLRTSTNIADAVVPGASADVNRAVTINVDHALTQRVKLGVSAGFATDHYVGINERDRILTLGATAEYHLSREVVLKASLTHQQFVSNLPGDNYTADTALIGVRLQR